MGTKKIAIDILMPLLLLCCMSMILFFSSCSSEEVQNLSSRHVTVSDNNNILNDGYAALVQDDIYYYQENPVNGLFHSKIGDRNKELLINGIISNIIIKDDTIFYISHTTDFKGVSHSDLFKYNLVSADNRKVMDNCSNVIINKDKIYFCKTIDTVGYKKNKIKKDNDSYYIYRMSLDGTNIEPVVKEFVSLGFEVFDQYLYYSNGSSVFKKDLNNLDENGTVIFQQEKDSTDGVFPSIQEWAILEEPELYVYSPNGYPEAGLIKYNWNTKKTSLILENSVDSQIKNIAIGNSGIYYLDSIDIPCKIVPSTWKIETLKKGEDISRIYLFYDKYVLWSPNNTPIFGE